MREEYYNYWFASLMGISCKKKLQLLDKFSCAKNIYNIEEKSLLKFNILTKAETDNLTCSRDIFRIQEEYERIKRQGIEVFSYGEKGYPTKLLNIASPPFALYVKGQFPKEKIFSVAVIGARKCSPYGEQITKVITQELSDCGVQIISGMARGIDGIAQNTALSRGAYSCAVLAGGVDVCYPREHIELYMELEKKGGIVSEQCPGRKPLASYFPARNRVISGLADVVLVIEAKEQSGTLITVDRALEQGREVYAVPGVLTSDLSRGCHSLIRQGAGIFTSVRELFTDMGIEYTKKGENDTRKKIMLEKGENLVYSRLDLSAKHVEQIICETKLASNQVMSHLISLEMEGLIREISKNYYVKIQ